MNKKRKFIHCTIKTLKNINVANRTKQFSKDTYCEENMLLGKYCKHSVNHAHKHTKKLQVASEKHTNNKRKIEDKAKGNNNKIAK